MLRDAQKLQFYGYFKQATKGDYTGALTTTNVADAPADFAEAAKLEAWAGMRGLSRRDAMRAFVQLLCEVVPAWTCVLV